MYYFLLDGDYMPCTSPLKGYKSIALTKNGKRQMVFNRNLGYVDLKMQTSCGHCRSCRIRRSVEWACRCENEMQMHKDNCFITLTYASEHLPPGGTLVKKHFQDFLKRFRERITNPSSPYFVSETAKIKYYYAGEYGDKLGRPHYHAIIFGYDFKDRFFPMKRPGGFIIYRSHFLEELWPYGHSSVGTATFQSAGYVARYIMKKITGDRAEEHYRVYDLDTGEVFDRLPEYNDMSRRSGIGKEWFEKYMSDVYTRDEVITLAGKRLKPPRYYDSQFELIDPYEFKCIKDNRIRKASKRKDDNTPERLEVKAKVLEAKLKMLKRDL